jgi:hypothetical protein
LWRSLRIDKTMMRLLAGRRRDERAERVVRTVANRALAPSSKLAAARWVNEERAHRRPAGHERRCVLRGDGLANRDQGRVGEEVFGQVASLLNLEHGQRTGEFDDRLPVSWLITAVIGLGHSAGRRKSASGRMSAADAGAAYRDSVLRGLRPPAG